MKRLRYLLSFIIVAMAVLATSCGGSQPRTRLETSLDSLFTPMFADNEPGAIVLIARGDSIIYDKGFGVANMRTMEPICDTTLFNICSISKQFSAIALLKLQEEGKLSLDDNVSKYFPRFKADFFHKITLRHLLSHTSGLPDLRPRTREQWNEYLKKNHSLFANERDYRLYALWLESTRYYETLDSLTFEPGTAYEYQNPTFQLALPIVESVTGKKFTEWMDSAVFSPAGLQHTEYLNAHNEQPYFAHAYRPADSTKRYNYYRSDDGRWEEFDYGEADFFPTKADGGLYTSALEFLKYEKALFDGKVLSDESMRQALTPVIGTDIPRTSYGLGLFIEHQGKDVRKIYHTGDNGGFLTVEAYFPDKDLFYLIFANRPDWDREKTAEKVENILASQRWI